LLGIVRFDLVESEGRRFIAVGGGEVVESGVAGQLVANREGESMLYKLAVESSPMAQPCKAF
jgi:hypothetical protein